jgi:ascorbate-specific PTS system EIIC-type component UlaA
MRSGLKLDSAEAEKLPRHHRFLVNKRKSDNVNMIMLFPLGIVVSYGKQTVA